MKNLTAIIASLVFLAVLIFPHAWAPAGSHPWLVSFYALFVWAAVTLAAYGLGQIFLRRLQIPFSSATESAVFILGLGYGSMGYIVLLAGFLGGLFPFVFWAFLSFLFFFTRKGKGVGEFQFPRFGLSFWEKVILFALAFLILTNVILSFPPPTARDALTQHLALPKLYIQQNRIYDIPFSEAAYNPMQVDMLYTLTLLLGSEQAASLIHGTYAVMTAALVYFFLRGMVFRWLALLGALFFLSTPLVVNLSSKAYVDLGLAFYALGAIYVLIQDGRERGEWRVLAALFAGLAAATKYNGFLVLFLLVPWVIRNSQSEEGSLFSWKGAAGYLTISLAMVSPWLLKNFLYTGNPIYPFLANGWGNRPPLSQEAFAPLTLRALLYGEGAWDFMTIPLRIFFQGKDDFPRYFDGVLNPLFLVFFPFGLWGPKEHWPKWVGGFIITYFLFALFLTDMRARYILPTLAPLAVLAALGLARLWRVWKGQVWVVLAVAFLFLNVSYLQSYICRVGAGLYLLGKEPREEYLSRKLQDYDLWQYANRHLPPDSKVMMYFMGNRGYYCDREYVYESYYSGKKLKEFLSFSPSTEGLRKFFSGQGITHIVLRRDLFDTFRQTNLSPGAKEIWEAFGRSYLQLLFAKKGYELYEIKGG
jgi:hypothetical protein